MGTKYSGRWGRGIVGSGGEVEWICITSGVCGGDMEVNVVVVERYFLENIKILIK